MALSGKYSAKLNKFKNRLANAILVYTLNDGSIVKVVSMLENMEVRRERSTIDMAIPMYEQPNGKMTFLPNGSDEFDYTDTFSFNVWNGGVESDFDSVMFQFILTLSGIGDAIIATPSNGMEKEGIVSVALSFEK